MSCKRKIPLGENVLDAAQKRIEWLFDTFEQITLSFSGGKDSTVLFIWLQQRPEDGTGNSMSCFSTGKYSIPLLSAMLLP